MELKKEFAQPAAQPGTDFRGLCRHFRISPTVGYKWLGRYPEQKISDRHSYLSLIFCSSLKVSRYFWATCY